MSTKKILILGWSAVLASALLGLSLMEFRGTAFLIALGYNNERLFFYVPLYGFLTWGLGCLTILCISQLPRAVTWIRLHWPPWRKKTESYPSNPSNFIVTCPSPDCTKKLRIPFTLNPIKITCPECHIVFEFQVTQEENESTVEPVTI